MPENPIVTIFKEKNRQGEKEGTTRGIRITAKINSIDRVPTIEYKVEECADPYITGRDELPNA